MRDRIDIDGVSVSPDHFIGGRARQFARNV